MLNQVVLVGRLVRDVQINKTEKGKNIATITLAIPRSFKNMDGLYDTDFVDCILWENIAVNTKEYCTKGNIVGIRGRVQSRIIEEDNINKNVMQLVAEKVTFLSSDKNEENKENE